MLFVDHIRQNRHKLESCDCGAKSGHAHPKTCARRVSMDKLFHEWTMNDPSGKAFRSDKDLEEK